MRSGRGEENEGLVAYFRFSLLYDENGAFMAILDSVSAAGDVGGVVETLSAVAGTGGRISRPGRFLQQ